MSDEQTKIQESEQEPAIPVQEPSAEDAGEADRQAEDVEEGGEELSIDFGLAVAEVVAEVVQQELHDFAVVLTTPIKGASGLLAEFQNHLRVEFENAGFILPGEAENEAS